MEEMIDDTLEMEEDEELDAEADAEVDKVLYDLTNGKLGQAGTVGTELPVCSRAILHDDDLDSDIPESAGRRRDRAYYGAVSTAIERTAEHLIPHMRSISILGNVVQRPGLVIHV